MLSDEQFNALEWGELTDLQELTGVKIEGIEPVSDGAVMCGIVLYIKRADGSKAAVMIDAPDSTEESTESLYIEIAPIKTGGGFLEDMLKFMANEGVNQ